jgi:O-methyltransferase
MPYRKFLKKLINRAADKPTEDHPYYERVDRGSFDDLYDTALARTNTPPAVARRARFYNLYTFSAVVKELDGGVCECGVWKGLSSSLLLSHGYEIWALDSYEGLSAPTERDGKVFAGKGKFSASLDEVRSNLMELSMLFGNPKCHLVKGWIPGVFNDLPEQKWKFVHVDVDLVEPTIASLTYFVPRLVEGGILVCDDYGSRAWPNLKKEVDYFCNQNNIKAAPLSTGQLIIFG